MIYSLTIIISYNLFHSNTLNISYNKKLYIYLYGNFYQVPKHLTGIKCYTFNIIQLDPQMVIYVEGFNALLFMEEMPLLNAVKTLINVFYQ